MIKQIIFFHNHVNGDSVMSRIFVRQITQSLNKENIEFYYTAPRAISSYCNDIGIKKENFNLIGIPYLNHKIFDLIDNNLYINVWIGNYDIKCCFCMKDIIKHYNNIINDINNKYNLNIGIIPDQNPFINFDYSYYNFDPIFFNNYIKNQNYLKIISIYNVLPQTFITLCNINFNYIITQLALEYKNYLFITFCNTNLNLPNVISFNKIYDLNLIDYGVQFAYMSTLCDNIIGMLSGVCQFLLNDNCKSIDNKISIIYDIQENTPEKTPLCIMKNNYLCVEKINIKCYKYFNNDKLLLDYLRLFISNLIFNEKNILLDQLIDIQQNKITRKTENNIITNINK